MGDNKEMTYPDMLNRFRERRNESTVLLPLMSLAGQSFDTFKEAQSCLSIGPGPGEYDLEFVRRSLPKLRKLVAVERDHHCAEDLKANIARAYDGTLSSRVIESDVEDFRPSDGEKFDVVLMFHMLYDLGAESRRKLLRTALEEWLEKEGGVLVVVNMSDDWEGKVGEEERRPINVMQKLHRYFADRMDLLLESDDVRRDLEELGAGVVWSRKYRCDMDFRVFDGDVVQLFNMYSRKIIDPDTMKRALAVSAPEGLATYVGEMLIARKDFL